MQQMPDQMPPPAAPPLEEIDAGLQIDMADLYQIVGQLYVEKVASEKARVADRTTIARLRSASARIFEATRAQQQDGTPPAANVSPLPGKTGRRAITSDADAGG